MSEIRYKRVLLKVSGEALGEKTAAGDGFGLDFQKVNAVCASIKECVDMGVQVGLVIGGGNFWRGVKNGSGKMQRSHADAMGMLATVMNAIAVADALEAHGLDARVLTAVEMHKFAEYFTRDTANRYLNEVLLSLLDKGCGDADGSGGVLHAVVTDGLDVGPSCGLTQQSVVTTSENVFQFHNIVLLFVDYLVV